MSTALSRQYRRALAKAQRRTPPRAQPRAPRSPKLSTCPWKIAAVWAPVEAIMRRMEIDGSVDAVQGRPVAQDHGAGLWYEIGPALEGLAEFHQIAAARKRAALDVSALRKFATKLTHGAPILAADLAAVRACAQHCKALARTMTVDEADSILQTVRVGIALEAADKNDARDPYERHDQLSMALENPQ